MTPDQFSDKYNIDFWETYNTISCGSIADKADDIKALMTKLGVRLIEAILELRTCMEELEYYLKAAKIQEFLIAIQIAVEMDNEIKIEQDDE